MQIHCTTSSLHYNYYTACPNSPKHRRTSFHKIKTQSSELFPPARANHNLSFILNKSQTQQSQIIKLQKSALNRRYTIERNTPQESTNQKVTPFQERKMKQKCKNSKIMSKIFAKQAQKIELTKSQKNWLVVKQINSSQTFKGQRKVSDNIRETDTTLKEYEDPLQRHDTNHTVVKPEVCFNSWLFPYNNAKLQKKQDRLVNKKVTFNDIWKAQRNRDAAKLFNDTQEIIHNTQKMIKQKAKEMILRKGGKTKRINLEGNLQGENQIISSIHNTKQKTTTFYKNLRQKTSSVLNIRPCQLNRLSTSQLRHSELSNTLSESKLEYNKRSRGRYSPNKRVNHSCNVIKAAEDPVMKEISAWEQTNEFTDRQNIF